MFGRVLTTEDTCGLHGSGHPAGPQSVQETWIVSVTTKIWLGVYIYPTVLIFRTISIKYLRQHCLSMPLDASLHIYTSLWSILAQLLHSTSSRCSSQNKQTSSAYSTFQEGEVHLKSNWSRVLPNQTSYRTTITRLRFLVILGGRSPTDTKGHVVLLGRLQNQQFTMHSQIQKLLCIYLTSCSILFPLRNNCFLLFP